MNKFYIFLIISITLCVFNNKIANAQNNVVAGQIIDENDNPVVGVNILIKGTVTGTISDLDGAFRITFNKSFPVTLLVSSVGFQSQEIEVQQSDENIQITLIEGTLLGQEVVVSASRVEESIMKSPVSVEKMNIRDISESPSPNFYDNLKTLKGVDFSTQSLTFSTINLRGFGANGNTRTVQLIDGIDNQAPGLNFPVANIVGIPELDLESVEILPGAASALYGPNALNGIILMKSKSPFDYQGVSATMKTGINHVDEEDDDLSFYQNYGFRYAKALNDKFAFKFNVSYLRANDFIGVDYRDQSDLVERSGEESEDRRFDRITHRTYQGVNIYGDPLLNVGILGADVPDLDPIRALIPTGPNGDFTPTGYEEQEFVDNTTESLKLNGALHYRLTENIEVLGQFNWGQGSTVYTANDRFVLDDFSIWNAKLEVRGSNFFARAYTTQENSGDSYAANTLASLINIETFVPEYIGAFGDARVGGASVDQAHAIARQAAEAVRPEPGSPTFDRLFDSLRNVPISEGGAKFLDRTSLWHYEGLYNFSDIIDPSTLRLTIGGNIRRYALESEGTLFALQDNGDEFDIDEFGAYVQLGKKFFLDKLDVSTSLRYDKNENFDGQFSPRVSGVYTIAGDHNIRASFQRGFRIPTTQDQFIDLDVVTRRLVGSNPILVDRFNFESNQVYFTESVLAAQNEFSETGNLDAAKALLQPVEFQDFETEKVNTFEIGYKSLIGEKLFIDAYYYFSRYKDFIAEIDFAQTAINGRELSGQTLPPFEGPADEDGIVQDNVPIQRFGFDVNVDGDVDVQGFAVGMEYALPQKFFIGGNVTFNELIDQQDLIDEGFNANFNTPKWRYNLKFYNREVVKNLGFNLNWRWQQAYLWESSFGEGIIPDYGTLDGSISYKIKSLKTIAKLGGMNLLNERYTTSFGNPRMGAIYYFSLTFDEFLN
ncbi:MAG TPA: TonB-dependent receptor domain-containing protein [Cyclobacteriaceae bacterium]